MTCFDRSGLVPFSLVILAACNSFEDKPSFHKNSTPTDSDKAIYSSNADSGSSDAKDDSSAESETSNSHSMNSSSSQTNSSMSGQNQGSFDCTKLKWESITTPDPLLCFKSTDEVLASLPSRALATWVMMRSTRSAQAASADKPRVIVVSPDGSFLLATSTDPSRSKDLELAVYNDEKKAWDFAGLDYSKTPLTLERDLCKTCHGSQLHPIWSSYPNWPMAVGGQNQRLQRDEVDLLNGIVQKKSSLPFVNHLQMQSNYSVGDFLLPASKFAGLENNHTLNLVVALKAARSFASKMLGNSLITESELLKVAGEQVCSYGVDSFTKFGYDVSKEMSHALVGTDKDAVNNAGNALETYYVGLELLNQLLVKDPALKTKIPVTTQLLEAAQNKLYLAKNLGEFFAAEDALKGSWQEADNSWFALTVKAAFKSGSAACRELGQ